MVELIKKYKSIILYIVFGGLTTLINIVVYYLCSHIGGFNTITSNVIAWILSVLFAYITNRKWVFESQNHERNMIVKEITSFFGCRLATGIMDIVIMYITVDILGLNGLIMKCLSNVIVIIVNYIASKVIIFK